MKQEKYSAQALAIAMVVLVVSSILAISIYSRVSKDKTLSLDERNSAEALEVSDLILNYLTAAPIKTTLLAVDPEGELLSSSSGITLSESSSKTEISTLLESLGSITNNLDNLSICPITVSDNTYFLNIRKADLDTYFEVRPGQIMALPIKGIALPDPAVSPNACDTTIKTAVRGDSGAGFTVTKVYAKSYTNEIAALYKPYEEADVLNYCFASSSTCNNEGTLGGGLNWITFKDDGSQDLTIALNEKRSYNGVEYGLDEVKITAVGGTIGISYNIPTGCTEELNMINVQAGANCSGTYRGKSVLIPAKQWEVPLFNYVLFNGEGSL